MSALGHWRARRGAERGALVSILAWVEGGRREEVEPGESWVLARMLTEGTRERDWRQLAELGERGGWSLSSHGGSEAIFLRLDAVAEKAPEALALLAEIIDRPAWDPERLELVCEQGQAELLAADDHPESRARWALRRALYGPGHPAARPLPGTIASLGGMRADTLRARWLHRPQASLVAVGPGVEGLADGAPPRPSDGGRPSTRDEDQQPVSRRVRVRARSGEQAQLVLGRTTVSRTDPDAMALRVAGVILGSGGGLEGRLPTRIREVEGLAYAVRVATMAGAGVAPGRLEVSVGTSAESLDRAEAAAREELARLCDEGPGEDELGRARRYLIGREAFRRETVSRWVEVLWATACFGEPEAWSEARTAIEAVDRAAVQRVAQRWLDPSRLAVARLA